MPQAEETTQRHQLEKRRDLEADLHHVQGAVNGNFLTEAPEVARSRLAPDRVLCDRYCGGGGGGRGGGGRQSSLNAVENDS